MPEQGNYKGDPRADLRTDSQYWQRLLLNCWHMEKDLYYILHGVRCGGGELILTSNSLMLRPGEWSEKKWDEIKQEELVPYREKLIEVLRVSRVMSITDEMVPAGW
ncbi:hypothetical protein [Syntrophobotulus glycolicus]|nr:hypothetical protein [Syntrophobotulus glycolicus]